MSKRGQSIHRLLIAMVLFVLAVSPGRVWADAAPPMQPKGAAVSPGEAVTQVRMVSEEVLLTVDGPDADGNWEPAATVEAHFWMLNTGDASEAFAVWFPLGTFDGYGGINPVGEFQAWVDGVPAITEEVMEAGDWDIPVPWATWPAVFPPGETVQLDVSYRVKGMGWDTFYTFDYLLETGAGWWDSIGEGTIRVRLPYPVGAANTELGDAWYPDREPGWMEPRPAGFVVEGNEVVWRFEGLEPTQQDNVSLTIMAVPLWNEIVAARNEGATLPDSFEAQLRLARALAGGLYIRKGLEPVGDSQSLAGEALAAYQAALALRPDEVEILIEYLELMIMLPRPTEPVMPDTCRALLEAEARAGSDERVQQVRVLVDLYGGCEDVVLPTATLIQPTATLVPATMTATPISAGPVATEIPPSSSPVATEIPPAATVTEVSPAAPTTTPKAAGRSLCPGALGAGLLALLVVRRKD